MMHRVFAVLVFAAVAPRPVHAEPTLSFGGSLGINSDDQAADFVGTHPIVSVHGSYRFRTGTEPFVTGGLGSGGHEAVFAMWGAGVRQRLVLGRFEPYVELGLYEVGDDVRLSLAAGAGLGADVQLTERMFAGARGGHYFTADSDEIGGLDWYAGAYAGFRFGRAAARTNGSARLARR